MSRRYTLEECCTVLDVHPKTFKRWLKDDHVTTERSKADKRIKFLTEEQVKQLAELHEKPWPPTVSQEAEVIPVAAYKLLIEQMERVERQVEQISTAQAALEAAIAELREQQEDATRQRQADSTEVESPAVPALIEQAEQRLHTQFQSDLATLRQEFEQRVQDIEQSQTSSLTVLATRTEQQGQDLQQLAARVDGSVSADGDGGHIFAIEQGLDNLGAQLQAQMVTTSTITGRVARLETQLDQTPEAGRETTTEKPASTRRRTATRKVAEAGPATET